MLGFLALGFAAIVLYYGNKYQEEHDETKAFFLYLGALILLGLFASVLF